MINQKSLRLRQLPVEKTIFVPYQVFSHRNPARKRNFANFIGLTRIIFLLHALSFVLGRSLCFCFGIRLGRFPSSPLRSSFGLRQVGPAQHGKGYGGQQGERALPHPPFQSHSLHSPKGTCEKTNPPCWNISFGHLRAQQFLGLAIQGFQRSFFPQLQ